MRHLILLVCLAVSLFACENRELRLKADKAAQECIEKNSKYYDETVNKLDTLGRVLAKRSDEKFFDEFVNVAKWFLEDELKKLWQQLDNLNANCVVNVKHGLLPAQRINKGEKTDVTAIFLVKRDCESLRKKHRKRVDNLKSKMDHLTSLKEYYDRFGPPVAVPKP